jgi:hypothetical protein
MFSEDLNLFQDIVTSQLKAEKNKKTKTRLIIDELRNLIIILKSEYISYEVSTKVKLLEDLLCKIE